MENNLQYQIRKLYDETSRKSYNQWLKSGALMAGQQLIEERMTAEIENHPMSGFDYSVSLFADLIAPHFRHLCFTHHGRMFCALIVKVRHEDPKTMYVDFEEYTNLCRESHSDFLCPIILPLWEDTLAPAIEGAWPFVDAHNGEPVNVEQFDFEWNREVTSLELRVHAVSMVCQKLVSEGYTNIAYCEVPTFAPEIQCSKGDKRVAFFVKSTPTGRVDDYYRIDSNQIAAVNADEYYVAEVTFDHLKGNDGDFRSKTIPRGYGLVGGIQRIVSLENVREEMPYVGILGLTFPDGAKKRPMEEMLVDGVLTIPDDWEEIPEGCFSGRADIEKVIIGSNVYRIGNEAFAYCRNLKEVEGFWDCWVEDFVDDDTGEVVSFKRHELRNPGSSSFLGCVNLSYPRKYDYLGNIMVALQAEGDEDVVYNALIAKGHAVEQLRIMIREEHPEFLDRDLLEKQCELELTFGDTTFHYAFLSGFLFCKEEECCMAYFPEFAAKKAVFPEWVTWFSRDYYRPLAYKSKDTILQELVIPSIMGYLPEYGFENSAALESVTLSPVGIGDETYYDDRTFAGCNKLKRMVISGGSTIGYSAFHDMESLEEIVFESYTSKDGELMNDVTIYGGAFCDCGKLKRIVNNGCNLIVHNGVFDGCSALVGGLLPDGFEVFHDCLYYKGMMVGLWCGDTFIFPEGATKAEPTRAKRVFLPATIVGEKRANGFERGMGMTIDMDIPAFDFWGSPQEVVVPIGMKQHFVEIFGGDVEYEEFEEHCVEADFVCDKVLKYKIE